MKGKDSICQLCGIVTFQNVIFTYPDNGLVLFRDLSVKIQAGLTVALVGSSGSGKSTFVNMILGLYRPEEGSIKIDDNIIEEVDMRFIRRQIGVVALDAFIFPGTVKDIITHARENHSMDEIIQAAKEANAYNFIMELDNGVDT